MNYFIDILVIQKRLNKKGRIIIIDIYIYIYIPWLLLQDLHLQNH